MTRTTIAFLVVIAIVLTSCAPQLEDDDTIPMNPAHQRCDVDADCTSVNLRCSGCSCGTPVNVDYAERYREQTMTACEDYKGGICDLYCEPREIRCVERTCVFERA